MDDRGDALAGLPTDGAIGDMIGKLLARPDLIKGIADELGLGGAPTQKEPDGDPPLPTPKISSAESNRSALLCALRPYLNEKRRAALDTIERLGSVGSLLGKTDLSLLASLLGGDKNV